MKNNLKRGKRDTGEENQKENVHHITTVANSFITHAGKKSLKSKAALLSGCWDP